MRLSTFMCQRTRLPQTLQSIFVAWFASEGFKIADKFEPTPSPQDANTEIARMMADVLARGAIHAKLTEVGQLQTTTKVREAITLLMSGQN